MKKTTCVLMLIAVFLSTDVQAQCGNIGLDKLPSKAQKFIETYFYATFFDEVKWHENDSESTYSAKAVNGIVVIFDKSGNWLSVKSSYDDYYVPMDILPSRVRDKILKIHKNDGRQIVEVSKIKKHFKIKIKNGDSLSVR